MEVASRSHGGHPLGVGGRTTVPLPRSAVRDIVMRDDSGELQRESQLRLVLRLLRVRKWSVLLLLLFMALGGVAKLCFMFWPEGKYEYKRVWTFRPDRVLQGMGVDMPAPGAGCLVRVSMCEWGAKLFRRIHRVDLRIIVVVNVTGCPDDFGDSLFARVDGGIQVLGTQGALASGDHVFLLSHTGAIEETQALGFDRTWRLGDQQVSADSGSSFGYDGPEPHPTPWEYLLSMESQADPPLLHFMADCRASMLPSGLNSPRR